MTFSPFWFCLSFAWYSLFLVILRYAIKQNQAKNAEHTEVLRLRGELKSVSEQLDKYLELEKRAPAYEPPWGSLDSVEKSAESSRIADEKKAIEAIREVRERMERQLRESFSVPRLYVLPPAEEHTDSIDTTCVIAERHSEKHYVIISANSEAEARGRARREFVKIFGWRYLDSTLTLKDVETREFARYGEQRVHFAKAYKYSARIAK
jgi:hypothetical protein